MEKSQVSTLQFVEAARSLSSSARQYGLQVPTFRSPPRIDDVQRSIRWGSDASTISVVLRGRPWNAVLADMIEGIIVANGLGRSEADHVRGFLWIAVQERCLAA